MVRTITRPVEPVGFEYGGKGFCVTEAEPVTVAQLQVRKVRSAKRFSECDEAAQQLLLAVASRADRDGIAGGKRAGDGTASGVSVAELALNTGLSKEMVETSFNVLYKKKLLDRFKTTLPPHGLVWILLPDCAEAGLAVLA